MLTQVEREQPSAGATSPPAVPASVDRPLPEPVGRAVVAASEQPFEDEPGKGPDGDSDDVSPAPPPWPPVEASTWSRPRTATGLGEVIAVLVGGLLAFPMTLLICWWGMAWDPFGVAPRLRPELRWLAPPNLVTPESHPISEP